MNKTVKKLQLNKESLRKMQRAELGQVVGGAIPRTQLTCDPVSCRINSCEICGPY